MSCKVFSFGGGVQSTSVLVLAARGELDYETFTFANVGEDSEDPETLDYLYEVAMPFARRHGLDLIELRRDGPTLLEHIHETDSIPIPVRMPNGAPGRRNCTMHWKMRVVAKWTREHGATKATPATVGLGISLDEAWRMRTDAYFDYQELDYPLVRHRLTRNDCRRIIHDADLPEPPKSSCWFCPFRTIGYWRNLRANRPDRFERAAELEQTLIERRREQGKDPVYLTRRAAPLHEAIEPQMGLFDEDAERLEICESGYCMT